VYTSSFANDANYLLGQITEEEFKKFNQTNSRDWYCLGMKHLLNGDKNMAQAYLLKYVEGYKTENLDEEALEAKIPELKALKK
jgi:hypothetical protein